MAIWLIRAGSHGEHEQKFVQEKRVYLTWERFQVNLAKLPSREALLSEMAQRYPNDKLNTVRNWARQIWPFACEIQRGDWVVVPLKQQPSIYIGEVTGEYHFESAGPDPYFHWLPVKWIGEAIPRDNFAQDILYSFGAFLTICRIRRNNAEARLKAMSKTGWKPERGTAAIAAMERDEDDEGSETDLEAAGQDQIAQLISAKFKGHAFTVLVEAVLKAEGYTTYRSPEGADGGADILAGSGALGFGAPRIVVEVKSEVGPIDRPTVDKLLGAVSKFGADEGLFVSWSGFKAHVQKELAPSFFKVRLWTRKELLEHLFANYEKLDQDIRAELPLKRVWTVAAQEED